MTSRRSRQITGTIHKKMDHVTNPRVEIDEDGLPRFLRDYRTVSHIPVRVVAHRNGGRR
jgi:hypothetical protein